MSTFIDPSGNLQNFAITLMDDYPVVKLDIERINKSIHAECEKTNFSVPNSKPGIWYGIEETNLCIMEIQDRSSTVKEKKPFALVDERMEPIYSVDGKVTLTIYYFKSNEKGERLRSFLPVMETNFTLQELKEFVKETVTVKKFMGDT